MDDTFRDISSREKRYVPYQHELQLSGIPAQPNIRHRCSTGDLRIFRTKCSIWRAALDSAPKGSPNKDPWRQELEKHVSAVLPLDYSRLRGCPESNRELQLIM